MLFTRSYKKKKTLSTVEVVFKFWVNKAERQESRKAHQHLNKHHCWEVGKIVLIQIFPTILYYIRSIFQVY